MRGDCADCASDVTECDELSAAVTRVLTWLHLVSSVESPVREGQVFNGKFRIERLIGEGAMAVVVEATHLGLDERVALKFLRRAALAQPELVARFRREARASVKIKSDHVAKVFDVGDAEDGTPFIVMELLAGTDLSLLLQIRKRLEAEEVADFVIQACEGIAAAHVRGIVHRDIKPENLFLAQGPGARKLIKVLDFGISKAALGASPLDLDLASHHTSQIMGSPHYMSPEQLRSTRDVDARADIWSLGVVIFELLTGDTPFTSSEVTSLIAQILHDPHQRLGGLRADLPEGLEAVVDRCLAKSPDDRFQDAAELAAALLPFAPKRARASVERIKDIARTRGGSAASDADSIPPPPAPTATPTRSPETRNATSQTAIASAVPVAEPSPRRRGGVLWLLGAVVLLAGVILVMRMLPGGTKPQTALELSSASASVAPPSPAVMAATSPTTPPPATAETAAAPPTTVDAAEPGAPSGSRVAPPLRPWKTGPAAVPARPASAPSAPRNPDSEIRMER